MPGKESLVLQYSLENLQIHQLWPKNEKTKRRTFYFRYFLTLLSSSPFWIGMLAHLIRIEKENLDVDASEDISMLASVAGLHIMLITFVWGQKKIAHLYDQLSNFENFGKPDDFDKRCRRLNLYSRLYSYYVIIAMTIYYIFKLLIKPDCERANLEKDLNEVCGLFVPFWAPFDVNFFPAKEILVLVQVFGVFMILKAGAAISFTTFEVSECIVLKMKHLCRLLREVFDDPSEEITKRRLNHCIKYHLHIISLQNLFDSRYKQCNGTYVLMVGIIIAGLVNEFINDRTAGAIVHLFGWIFSFFICCHAGQTIQSESMEIPIAALDSKWYEGPIDLQRDLLILVVNSQQGLYLHAIPIGIMSYSLYVTLVKTSYSYFTLLQRST